jgi:hypothetical protein
MTGIDKELCLLSLAGLIVCAPALANDTMAVLGAGGLVFQKTGAITMQREDLTISRSQVRVRYEMRNDGREPVTLRVAFPLPATPVDTPSGVVIDPPDGSAVQMELPSSARPNFLGFVLFVNNLPVRPQVEIRAVLPDGRDIAPALHDLGGWSFVLNPHGYFMGSDDPDLLAYDAGPEQMRRLRALDAVQGDDVWVWPRWKTLVTYHWQQTFPPVVTVIEHRYEPVAGGFWVWQVDQGSIGDFGAAGMDDNLDRTFLPGQGRGRRTACTGGTGVGWFA